MAPQRILIVRTSALGDIVHALPVLTALRRHLPDTRLGWVVESAFAPLLEGHPDLDEIIEVRSRTWRRRPFSRATAGELWRFARQLHEFSADVVLDLMGNHKAGVIAAVAQADRRVGHRRDDRREPSSALWINDRRAARGTHAVDRALSLLDALDLPPEAPDFGGERLCLREPEDTTTLLPAGHGDFAVILPGAGWANKAYPPAAWGRVAAELGRAPGIPTVVVPGPGEENLAERVVAASARTAHHLAVTPLPQLAALLRRAALVMGGDTGPLHLAHALGTGVLCIMGPTDPRRSGPWGAEDRALWKKLPCSFCEQRLDGPRACVLELSPGDVVGRARRLLRQTAGPV